LSPKFMLNTSRRPGPKSWHSIPYSLMSSIAGLPSCK
jgi:hypothetical protein